MAEQAVGDRLQADHENMFKDTSDGKVYRRVAGVFSVGGGLMGGVEYDFVQAAYPDATTEVWTFKSGGSGGTIVRTLTITFVDSTKELIDNVVRT